MSDRRARARDAGDVPRAPAAAGWWAAAAGSLAALIAAGGAGWSRLAETAWGPGATLDGALTAAGGVVARITLATGLSAAVGAALGCLLVSGPAIRLRWRAKVAPTPRATGLLAAAGVVALGALGPAVVGSAGGDDPGRALIAALGLGLALGALGTIPAAWSAATRARQAWRDRVDPWPPPKRPEDEPDPAMKQAVRAPGQQ